MSTPTAQPARAVLTHALPTRGARTRQTLTRVLALAVVSTIIPFGAFLKALGMIEATQAMGGTTWQGGAAMRISVSNWSTTEADADRTVDAILRCHRRS